MKFGVMDHLDLSGDGPAREHYENRLRLLEIYEKGGFHGYHVTEHHCTPLGGGASPSIMRSMSVCDSCCDAGSAAREGRGALIGSRTAERRPW